MNIPSMHGVARTPTLARLHQLTPDLSVFVAVCIGKSLRELGGNREIACSEDFASCVN